MAEAMTIQTPKGGSAWFIKHVRTSSKMHKAIKAGDKVQFFQQLTTLFAAGTPLLGALHIASDQSQSLKMQLVIRTIAERVAGGASLLAKTSLITNRARGSMVAPGFSTTAFSMGAPYPSELPRMLALCI